MKISKQDPFVAIVRVHEYHGLRCLLVNLFQSARLWLVSWNNFTSKNASCDNYHTQTSFCNLEQKPNLPPLWSPE